MVVSTLVIALLGSTGAAVAEQPYDIVDSTTDDGTYVARSLTSTYDEAAWAPSIERARAAGVDLRVLAPVDPIPDAAAFALRVRQLADADAVIVFGPEGQLFAMMKYSPLGNFSSVAAGSKASAASTSQLSP